MEGLKLAVQHIGLTGDNLEIVCSKFKFREYAKNEFLLKPGQVANAIFFIENGSVILGNELSDQSVTRHMATKNQFITCLDSFLKQTTSTEFIKATEPTHVYMASKMDFDAMLAAFPAVQKFYNELIFDTLIQCQKRIKDLISLDAKAYYELISQDNPDLLQKMPLYDLASFMGIEPQSLSRLRKTIRDPDVS